MTFSQPEARFCYCFV